MGFGLISLCENTQRNGVNRSCQFSRISDQRVPSLPGYAGRLATQEFSMLNQSEMRRLVDMQQRSYRLLKWMAKAVNDGFVNFETAHDYSTLPEAAEGWILGHYLNIPDNARPRREDLPEFCAFFSTYLTNSFDFVGNPGKQLYSPDAHCFCPMCSWLVDAPNLKTKRVRSTDKGRAQSMRVNALLNLAAEHRINISENGISELLGDRTTTEDASLVAYGYDLLQREKGIAARDRRKLGHTSGHGPVGAELASRVRFALPLQLPACLS
jgi:hypothetical protein